MAIASIATAAVSRDRVTFMTASDLMSETTELLGTVVELSIGLAGFSGVVGIFIQRSGQWIYVDRFRVTNLLLMSLTPGFLSFISLGLIPIVDNAIRISAAFFACTIALLLTVIPRARSKVPDIHKPLVGLQIFLPMSLTCRCAVRKTYTCETECARER